MKTKKALLVSIAIAAALTALAANRDLVMIHNGFGTGQGYVEMSDAQKKAYAAGMVNGMLMAPLFGASKDEMKWLEAYLENMTDQQVAAIITKYLNDNPGRWHEGLHVLSFVAIKEAHDKSRGAATK